MDFYRNTYNDFFGMPSKYNTVFNRETERMPERETRMERFPMNWDRMNMENCPWFNRNWERTNWERSPMMFNRFDNRFNNFNNWTNWNNFEGHHMTMFCDAMCNFDRVGHCMRHFVYEFCDRMCHFDRMMRCERHHFNRFFTMFCERMCHFDRMGHCERHWNWENCDRTCNFDRMGRCERHFNWENNRMDTWNRDTNRMDMWNRDTNRTGNWNTENWVNNNTLTGTTFRPCCDAEYYTLRNPIRSYDRNTRGIWLCFDLRGFRHEEINVTFDRKERCIVIEAAHDTKDTKEHTVMRKYFRKFYLPEYMKSCDLSKVELKCFFGKDGFFYINGMLPHMNFDNWPAPNTRAFYGDMDTYRHWNEETFCTRFITCKYI